MVFHYRIQTLSLIAFFLICLVYAQENERRNLAVYTFDARGVSSIEAEAITDRIRLEISRSKKYNVIERGLMEEVLNEQAFQLSGACTESSCLVEVGNLLAVHYMIGGSVTHIGNLYTIEARIIDIETGDIIENVIEDYNGPIENLLVQTTKTVAAKLTGSGEESVFSLFTGTSDLLVSSNPPGGTIYLNDKPVGDITPYRLEGLKEGEYFIQVRKENLIGESRVTLARGERKEITVSLAPEKFTIRIYSQPEGVDALINERWVGQTPIDYTVTDTTLDYRIRLKKDLFFTVNDTVSFDNNVMLRLNYQIKPCGRILIDKQPKVDVFFGKTIKPDSCIRLPKFIRPDNKEWVLDQLELTDYQIRIEKMYYEPFDTTITLSRENPVQRISDYRFQRKIAQLIFSSNVGGAGKLSGSKSIPFSLKPGQNTEIAVPFGRYLLFADVPGYLPIKQPLSVFNKHLTPIALTFQRPSKKVAFRRSILFPGMGQIYSRQPKKGVVMSIVAGAGIGLLLHSFQQYNSEMNTYNHLADEYIGSTTITGMNNTRAQLNDSRDKLSHNRRQFLFASSVFVLSYSWNLVDITIGYPYE